jgi:SAM-dependent methyltransferase
LDWGARVTATTAAAVADLELVRARTRDYWDRLETLHTEQHALSGWLPWEKPLTAFFKSGSRIGVIGCGSGREMLALGSLGCYSVGVDCSPQAVQLARIYLQRAGIEAEVYLDDAVDFEFPGGSYDCFLFSWGTYGLIPKRQRRIELLKKLQKRLKPGGVLALFFHARERQARKLPEAVYAINRVVGGEWTYVPGDYIGRALNYEHYFTREEIAETARRAGLEVVLYKEHPEQHLAVLRPLQ